MKRDRPEAEAPGGPGKAAGSGPPSNGAASHKTRRLEAPRPGGPQPPGAPAKGGFKVVDWLPDYRLEADAILADIEVHHAADATARFSPMSWERRTRSFRPGMAHHRTLTSAWTIAELQRLRAAVPDTDRTAEARARRWNTGAAIAALQATAAVRTLGRGHVAAAAAARTEYLLAIDRGSPPTAAWIAAVQKRIPGCLAHLGQSLPGAEAVALATALGTSTIVEVGAGTGLFARALAQAGVAVLATDLDEPNKSNVGLAYPVAGSTDAEVAMAAAGGMPVAMLWPGLELDWFAKVFAAATPGQTVLLASPEMETVEARGGTEEIALLAAAGRPHLGWQAAVPLARRLATDFEPVGEAPMAPAGWPLSMVRLRAWRRLRD